MRNLIAVGDVVGTGSPVSVPSLCSGCWEALKEGMDAY